METPDSVKNLYEELACPICLEYMKDPVTIACGHNFCQACLSQCWGELEKEASCPQCREKVQERNLRPNRQLAKVMEIAKELSFQGGRSQREEERGRGCEKHQEPLKLFCKDHEVSICLVCDRSKEHENHKVIPVDEASEEYKDRIWSLVETLQKDRTNILAYKADTEQESQALLKQTKREKEKTVASFRQMHQFLEEQEKLLLAQMEDVENEISAKREEHLAILSEEVSSLTDLIQEIEGKHQQPASEFLQDIGSFVERCEKKEKFENPVVFPPALKWKIWDFCDINPFLEGVMKQFKDTLKSELQQKKANVTLDPETAYPWLVLSEDRKSVMDGGKHKNVPDNPERFNSRAYVLGQEGFTTGRHFWEVSVAGKEDWSLGVTKKSVKRKGPVNIVPEEGIWAVGKRANKFSATPHPSSSVLSLSEKTKRVRVSLNCPANRVAFYDADTGAQIYLLSEIPFSGDTVLPFFYVYEKGHLKISP